MTTGTQITVRRPGGEIEVMMRAGEFYTEARKAVMVKATREAGRGDIIGFAEITAPRSLESQRRDLVAAVQGAIDESSSAFERAHAREDVRAWDTKRQHDARADAARQALAAFDAAHPEIIAAIRAEKQEAAERFLRAD